MSFPAYPKYKEFGAGWLRLIPQHWEIAPLWSMFRRIKRTNHADEQLLSVYRDFGVISKASRDDNFNKPSDDLRQYQLVRPGDLAINKMKAWQGSVAVSAIRGIVSPAYHVYAKSHQCGDRYLHYLFRCAEYTTAYLSMSKGIRVNQWDLDPQKHSRMPVVLPPMDEQNRISHFLDHETAKIDALIAEQERLIQLLEEKRQAVISHAVTKGLDPDVPMKDSGVKWLGEIPAHWTVAGISKMFTIKAGGDLKEEFFSEQETPEHKYPIYTNTTSESAVYGWTSKPIFPGKALTVTGRGEVGHAIYRDHPFDAIIRLLVLQPIASASPEFFAHQINAVITFSEGHSAISQLSTEQLSPYRVACPPIDDQASIASFCTQVSLSIRDSIDESRKLIFLLRERRAAIISAAVTGKIDVRNWQPPTDESAFPQEVQQAGLEEASP